MVAKPNHTLQRVWRPALNLAQPCLSRCGLSQRGYGPGSIRGAKRAKSVSDKVPSLALDKALRALHTLGGPNCSSNICTSDWQWQQWCLLRLGGMLVAVEFHAHTMQPSVRLEECSRWAMFNVIFQQGSCTAFFFFALCCLGKIPGGAPFSQLHKSGNGSRVDRP